MNARILLSLSLLSAVVVLAVSVSAAETPAAASKASTSPSLPDNEAQAMARAALQMDEVNPVPAPKPAPQAPAAQTRPVTTKPKVKPAEPVPLEVAVPALGGPQPDNTAQAMAREALRQDEPFEAMPEPEETMPAVSQPQTVWVEQPMASPQAKPAERAEPKPVTTAPVKSKPQPNQSLTAGMQAPALPTTPQQQQALDALFQQYASDQISAADYHSRRAEILGGK